MTLLYIALALILLGVAIYLFRGRTPPDEAGHSTEARPDFSAPRVRVKPGTRGRCTDCGARRWPGSVRCWSCGHEYDET